MKPSLLSFKNFTILFFILSIITFTSISFIIPTSDDNYSALANDIKLPVEVIGEDGLIVQRTVNLTGPQFKKAKNIWILANNLSYNNKASIKVNDGLWIDLNNENVAVNQKDNLYGGIGGSLGSIRISIPITSFVRGKNTIQFRYNRLDDKISIGYRIIKFNILNEAGRKLLDETSDFIMEDPDTWTAPNPADIISGKRLWETAKLTQYPGGRAIKAKCMNCHTQSGMDLEYFSYSNTTIIERSKFHGLTKAEGEQIASYIRSLDVPRYGRPWNPPYQPGPQLDGKSIEWWAAGAGLDAVLENDLEMRPYLFPNGTNPSAMDAVFSNDGDLDMTELPIALQLMDWKHWLPLVHPMDVWKSNNFISGTANTEYQNLRNALKTADIDNLMVSGNITRFTGVLPGKSKKWISEGAAKGIGFRVLDGTTLSQVKSAYTREEAKLSLASWMAVKQFEIQQEFELEKKATLYAEAHNNTSYGVEGYRQWISNDRSVFEVAPHFLADDIRTFKWQTKVQAAYSSNMWYQLQVILNAGENDLVSQSGGGPVDWSYCFNWMNNLISLDGDYEPFRYVSNVIKMHQARTNKNGITDANRGFRMRYMHPIWMWSDQEKNQVTPSGNQYTSTANMEALDTNRSGLRVKILNSFLKEWVRTVNNYNDSDWKRVPLGQEATWTALESVDHVPSEIIKDVRPTLFWRVNKQHHADYMYRLIPELSDIGVNCSVLEDLAAWSERIWPKGDWKERITQLCKSKNTAPSISEQQLKTPEFKIYPTSKNLFEVFIETPNDVGDLAISAYNILGHKLQTVTIKNKQNRYITKLDMKSAPQGIYIVKVYNGLAYSMTKKIIVK